MIENEQIKSYSVAQYLQIEIYSAVSYNLMNLALRILLRRRNRLSTEVRVSLDFLLYQSIFMLTCFIFKKVDTEGSFR